MLKKLFIIITFIFNILYADYLQEANDALKKSNITKAIKLYKLSARDGVDEANFQLGKIYYLKKYNKRDLKKSFDYFKKAAIYEHQKAKYNLAVIYSLKSFDKHNYKEAYSLFHTLAQNGQANAQYRVGSALLNGLGVKKDYSLAKRWFEESYFKNEYKRSACSLAFMFVNGMGTIQNLGRARTLSEPLRKKYPLCRKVYKEFKLFKKKYDKDRGFKTGYYK